MNNLIDKIEGILAHAVAPVVFAGFGALLGVVAAGMLGALEAEPAGSQAAEMDYSFSVSAAQIFSEKALNYPVPTIGNSRTLGVPEVTETAPLRGYINEPVVVSGQYEVDLPVYRLSQRSAGVVAAGAFIGAALGFCLWLLYLLIYRRLKQLTEADMTRRGGAEG